jgi:hypothetical protein
VQRILPETTPTVKDSVGPDSSVKFENKFNNRQLDRDEFAGKNSGRTGVTWKEVLPISVDREDRRILSAIRASHG